jgi:hypothetical protein
MWSMSASREMAIRARAATRTIPCCSFVVRPSCKRPFCIHAAHAHENKCLSRVHCVRECNCVCAVYVSTETGPGAVVCVDARDAKNGFCPYVDHVESKCRFQYLLNHFCLCLPSSNLVFILMIVSLNPCLILAKKMLSASARNGSFHFGSVVVCVSIHVGLLLSHSAVAGQRIQSLHPLAELYSLALCSPESCRTNSSNEQA